LCVPQMGVNNAELWNNLGLCCFYASQYDMTLSCMERALAMADDDNMADIWHNVGQVRASGHLSSCPQPNESFPCCWSLLKLE
jgi:tetratricopeptide (TPR) repeat protein